MLVSIPRVGLRRHAVSRALVLVATLAIGHVVRSRAVEAHEVTRAAALGAATPVAVTNPAWDAAVRPTLAKSPNGRVEVDAVDVRPRPSPIVGLTGPELDRAARMPPASFGSVCIGRPNR